MEPARATFTSTAYYLFKLPSTNYKFVFDVSDLFSKTAGEDGDGNVGKT